MGFWKSKIIILAILLVLAITGFSLWSKPASETIINSNHPGPKIGVNQPPQTEKAKDSDNDGLPDWQEKIYGTDPQNPDSDGDGYKDGEEIASQHNPLKKAPDDLLADYPLKKNPSEADPNNLTKRLIAALAKETVELNKGGADKTKGLKVPKLSEFMPKFIKEQITPEEYYFSAEKELKAIKTSKDNGKKAIQNYFDKMQAVTKQYFSFSAKPGSRIVLDAYKTNDYAELDDLIIAYNKAIQEYYGITAPSDWADYHRDGIKILISSKKIFEALRDHKTDSIKAITAVRAYYDIGLRSMAFQEKIAKKLSEDNILE